MKYRLLTKEQLETLSQEFATFLAVQEIDKVTWDNIKKTDTQKVDLLLEQFSDLVWTEILNKTHYLEHFSKDSLNLFYGSENEISRIVVKINKNDFDFLNQNDFNWFLDHSNHSDIQYFKGIKKYQTERNEELFDLIEKGSVLSNGKLYQAIDALIHP